tara:strand:+ start:3229 stop:4965 length:1737 start_codon:yes stop_codon:yes gene_type:complete
MDTYTAVTDPDILAKVKSNISASTKDISKASEVTDPALFLKIQEQLKKDLETEEEERLASSDVESLNPFEQFGENITERLGSRGKTLSEISKKSGGFSLNPEGKMVYNAPEQLGLVTDIQTAGQLAGGVWDVLGETLVLGAKGISFVAPDFIKEPVKQGWKSGVDFITNSPKSIEALGAVKKGSEAYEEWKRENPETALTLESVVNVGLFFIPTPKGVKVKGNPEFVGAVQPPVLERGGRVLIDASGKQVTDRSTKKALELIVPKSGVPEQTREASKLGFNYNVVTPTAQEQKIVETVASLNIPKTASNQKSLNLIDDAIETEAKLLEKQVGASKESIPFVETSKLLDEVASTTKATDAFVSTNQLGTMVDDIVVKAKELLKANPQTPLGVLRTRKQLDAYVRSYKANKSAFPNQDNVETALSIALRDVRIALNNRVAQAVPEAKVLERLTKQSNLYKARPIVIDKAKSDASNSLGRLWQSVTGLTGVKMPTTPLAIGVTGAAIAGWLPAIIGGVGLGVAGRAVYSGAVSPQLKKFLGQSLIASSQALKVAKNPQTIKQLRADRAVILELLKNSKDEE